MYLLASILVLINSSVTLAQNTLYYENLINERTAKAQTYQLPQRNEEFKAGIDSGFTYDFGTFDFIIVGAGSAGSVLATRLSEIDDFRILLLEAGGEEDDFSVIPSMYMYLQFSDMNWGYYSTPQKNCCLGMREHKCMIPRGKLIGGCSSFNAAMYVRGNPNDYDKWADLGNPGWSYKEVLPYFIKSENSQIDGDPGYHGKGGLWNVEYSQPPSPLFSNFVDGNLELSIPFMDYNGKNQHGAGQAQFNIKHGKKQSTGTAFLDNARKRKNLFVKTRALATKIIINPDTNIARGVEFATSEEIFFATATKEVIVSGGAINSPQLLMLSGIGPRDHLEEMGIEVVADLPVGKNLLERPLFPGLVFRTNYTLPHYDVENMIESYLRGYGPFTKSNRIEGIGFIKSKSGTEDVPTVEYIFIAPGSISAPMFERSYNYDRKLTNSFLDEINPSTDVSFYLLLLHEKSTGRITLKSTNPTDFPNIDLNMLAEQEDVDNLIESITFVLNLAKTNAFKAIDAKLLTIPICSEFAEYSRKYWECVIRQMTTTVHHPCGTTAMGPDTKTSVVDSNLKVHGVERLRVVDAGVFPSTLSGHPNAAVVMAAEKIADVIKSDYGYLDNL